MIIFKDRKAAGIILADKLLEYKAASDVLILCIPRGGIVVGKEIAKKLKLPLDVVITRKIGAPHQPELSLGAVDPDGDVIWEKRLLDDLRFKINDLRLKIQEEKQEIKRREKLYRKGKKELNVVGKTIILVDDGVATGATMLSALHYLKRKRAKKVIIVVPVGAADAVAKIGSETDEIVVPFVESDFGSVGSYYKDFTEVSDNEVVYLMANT